MSEKHPIPISQHVLENVELRTLKIGCHQCDRRRNGIYSTRFIPDRKPRIGWDVIRPCQEGALLCNHTSLARRAGGNVTSSWFCFVMKTPHKSRRGGSRSPQDFVRQPTYLHLVSISSLHNLPAYYEFQRYLHTCRSGN